jgi:hypothetical protein
VADLDDVDPSVAAKALDMLKMFFSALAGHLSPTPQELLRVLKEATVTVRDVANALSHKTPYLEPIVSGNICFKSILETRTVSYLLSSVAAHL